ncbi:MAG: ribbon-helix-helix protein, CopG family [Methanosarcinales archaeon]|jgi:antitoxin ParD1/3/4|nr:ribbon-helix-helix protein, CopG family [Methanosarcinales archaeon]
MERITIRLPEKQLEMIDVMVNMGEFPSTSEAIRAAIRDLIDQRSDKIIRNMQLLERIGTAKVV